MKKIELDNTSVEGVKKMKLSKLGECLMISDGNNNIRLYTI